jgi:hypothetical protein
MTEIEKAHRREKKEKESEKMKMTIEMNVRIHQPNDGRKNKHNKF